MKIANRKPWTGDRKQAGAVAGHGSRSHDLQSLFFLTVLFLATSLPFVNRPYFVDDFYFVTMAKGILQHPGRPYDFVSADAGPANVAWEIGQPPRMINPPLLHYFLAGVIAVWGDAVWKLRTASLLFPLIALWCLYFLGKRFVGDPLAAASLVAITPVFWLSSYSLLIDSTMLAFFLAGLWAFIRGHERRSIGLMLLSGLLLGLTSLTKYTGLIAVPLVVLWHLLHRRLDSIPRTMIALAMFSIVFLSWGLWNIDTYGKMHFLATLPRGMHSASVMGLLAFFLIAIGIWIRRQKGNTPMAIGLSWFCALLTGGLMIYSLRQTPLQSWLTTFYIDKALPVASFLGGGLFFLIAAPLYLYRRSRTLWLLYILISLALFVAFISRYGAFSLKQGFLLAFFTGNTLAFLFLIDQKSSKKERGLRHERRFVTIWFVIGLMELIFVMPWTAGRYLLILLPPAAWLFRGIVEEHGWYGSWRMAWTATLLVGTALAYSDYAQANAIRRMADILTHQQASLEQISPRPQHTWYFLGDTFSGYPAYLEPLGWKGAFPEEAFHPGDLLLRAHYRTSSWWTLPDRSRFKLLAVQEFSSRDPLRVMDIPQSAGFYASVWGALPYVITTDPLEQFELYQVVK